MFSFVIFFNDLAPFFNFHFTKPIIICLFFQPIVKNIGKICWNILFREFFQPGIEIIKKSFRINMILFNSRPRESLGNFFQWNGSSTQKRRWCDFLITVGDSIRIFINRLDFSDLNCWIEGLSVFVFGFILIFQNIMASNGLSERPAILNLFFLKLVH